MMSTFDRPREYGGLRKYHPLVMCRDRELCPLSIVANSSADCPKFRHPRYSSVIFRTIELTCTLDDSSPLYLKERTYRDASVYGFAHD
jgi:hypothetical protein